MEISLYSKDKKYFCYLCKGIKLEYLDELGTDNLYQCPKCKKYYFQKLGTNKFEIKNIDKNKSSVIKNTEDEKCIKFFDYKKERLRYEMTLFIIKSIFSIVATFAAFNLMDPILNSINNYANSLSYKLAVFFVMIQSGFYVINYNVDKKIGFNKQQEKNILFNLKKAIEYLSDNNCYYDMECINSEGSDKDKIIEFIKKNLDLNHVDYKYIYFNNNNKNMATFTISKKDYSHEKIKYDGGKLSNSEKTIINHNIYADLYKRRKKESINQKFMLRYQKNNYKNLYLNCANYEKLYNEKKVIDFITKQLIDRKISWNNIVIYKKDKGDVIEANIEILL